MSYTTFLKCHSFVFCGFAVRSVYVCAKSHSSVDGMPSKHHCILFAPVIFMQQANCETTQNAIETQPVKEGYKQKQYSLVKCVIKFRNLTTKAAVESKLDA